MKSARTVFSLLITATGAVMVSACGRFIYGVEASNRGETGVLILQIGDRIPTNLHEHYSTVGVRFPIIAGLRPRLMGRNSVQIGQFQGYEESLPDEVEVVWQLAELVDCIQDDTSSPSNVEWSSCTWLPDRDRIYRRKLNIGALRETEEFKKTGKSYTKVAGSRYTLRVALVFDGDRVEIIANNATTNPWR